MQTLTSTTYYKRKEKANAKQLKRDAMGLQEKAAELGLRPTICDRLRESIDYADGVLAEAKTEERDAGANFKKKRFAKIVALAASRLKEHQLDPNALAVQIIDYWMECEAVHSGPNWSVLYDPEDFGFSIEMNGELTALVRLGGLYPIAAIATAAVLNAVGLMRTMPKPREAQELAEVARRAQEIIVALSKKARS